MFNCAIGNSWSIWCSTNEYIEIELICTHFPRLGCIFHFDCCILQWDLYRRNVHFSAYDTRYVFTPTTCKIDISCIIFSIQMHSQQIFPYLFLVLYEIIKNIELQRWLGLNFPFSSLPPSMCFSSVEHRILETEPSDICNFFP